MRLRRSAAACLAIVGVTLATAGTAAAKTIVVHPGESIQAAVDAASPGDTVQVKSGKYAETVAITTDRITLKTKGATIVPPDKTNPRCFNAPLGICVLGKLDENGNVVRTV